MDQGGKARRTSLDRDRSVEPSLISQIRETLQFLGLVMQLDSLYIPSYSVRVDLDPLPVR